MVEQTLAKNVELTGSAFYYQCSDLIMLETDPSGILFFDNLSRVRTVGGEIEVHGKLESGIEGRMSYSYANAEDRDTGNWLANSPRNLLKFNLTLPVAPEKFLTSLELQYMGRRKSFSGTDIHDYVVANLTLFSRELAPGLDVSASIFNLFNRKYFDSGGPEHRETEIEQDGISFGIKLTYRF